MEIDKIEAVTVDKHDVIVLTVDNRYFKSHSVESLISFVKIHNQE